MADLLQALRQGGEVDSCGFFTVDRRKAQEKMREFQLVDAHDYVLNLVAAGVALGATGLHLEIDSLHVRVRLAGVRLPVEFLEQPFAGLFISQEARDLEGYRELSIGLNAVLSLKPREFVLSSGDRAVHLEAGDDPHVETVSDCDDTVVSVSGRLSWRLDAMLHETPEAVAVRSRGCYTPVPLWLNRVPVESPRPAGAFEVDGRMWLVPGTGTVEVVKHGVLLCKRHVALPPPLVDVLAVAEGVLKNVSSTDVVEDERWQRVLNDLQRACDEYVDHLCIEFTADGSEERRLALVEAVGARVGRLSPRLAGAPVFCRVDRQPVSFLDMAEALKTHKALHYLDRPYDGPLPGDYFLVSAENVLERAALNALFGKSLRPAGEELQRLVRRNHNMQAWKTSGHALALAPNPYLVVVSFDEQGYRGELGIVADGGPAEVSFCREHRRLTTRSLDVGLSFRAYIDSEAFMPSFLWDDVEADDAYRKALALLDNQYASGCRRLAETIHPPHPDVPKIRVVLRRWLAQPRVDIPQAVREYPLFPTVSTRHASLVDLARDVDDFGRVHFVLGMAAGPQKDHRQIVIGQADLLQKLFPKAYDYSRELRAERKVLEGPSQLPTLAGEALYPVSFQRGPISGVVGLSLGPAGKRRPSSTVRLFLGGKPLETRTLNLEFGPVEAVLDSPNLTPTGAWDAAVQDQHLAQALDVLREGCGELALALIPHYAETGDWKHAPMREFLLDYLAWLKPTGSPLLEVPLFPQLHGPDMTLAQVRSLTDIRYVGARGNDTPEELPGPVMVVPASEVNRFAALAGVPTRNWDKDLQHALYRKDFYRRPPRKELSLPSYDADYLDVVSVQEAGSHVMVGLLPPDGDFKGKSSIRLFLDGRLIESIQMNTPVPVQASATGPLEPTSSYDGVRRDVAYETVYRRILGCIETGVDRLMAKPCTPHTPESQCLVLWAVSQVKGAAAFTRPTSARLGSVVRLPLLDDSLGRPMTLEDVANQWTRRRKLYWVGDDVSGTPLDGDLQLVRLTALEGDALKRIMTPAVDYRQQLIDEEAIRERRGRTPVSELVASEPVHVRLLIQEAGLRGVIAISADERRGVGLVVDDLLVQTRPIFGELPVVGMLAGPELKPNRQWTSVTLPSPQVRALDAALDRLYAELAQDLGGERFALLMAYFHHRHDRLAAHKYPDAARVPLFDTLSLADVLAAETVSYAFQHVPQVTHGIALSLSGRWDPALPVLQELLGPRLVQVSTPSRLKTQMQAMLDKAAQTVRQSATRLPERIGGQLLLAAESEKKLAAQVGAPVRRAQEAWGKSWQVLAGSAEGLGRRLVAPFRMTGRTADRVAGTECLRRLQACLLSLPRRREVGLTDGVIRRIQITSPNVWTSPVTGIDLITFSGGPIAINLRHPLMQRLMARGADPGAIALLASTMVTTLRHHERSITDERERVFIEDLAEWLATDRGR